MSEKKANQRVARIVKCPRCGKSVRYDESNPWRPFCSNRCKTIDIAAWADEEYRVPGPPVDPFAQSPMEHLEEDD